MMFRKALIPFLLVTAFIVTLAPQPAITHAQDDDIQEQFALPVDDLVTQMKRFDELALSYELSAAASSSGGYVPLAVAVETGAGDTYDLALNLVPVIREDLMYWQVADWQLTDDQGTALDDPPGIIAILIGQLKQEWNRVAAEGLLQSAQAAHPEGPPGQPEVNEVSVQNGDIIIDLTWKHEVGARDVWDWMDVPWGEIVRTDEEGNPVYFIPEAEVNAAKQIIFDTDAMIQELRYELAEEQVVAVVSLQGVEEDNQATVRLAYAPNPDFDGSAGTVYPFLGPDAGSNAVFAWIRWDLMDGSMDSGDDAAQRGAIIASKALNRYLAAQINFAEVIEMRAVDGGVEVTVAASDSEENTSTSE
jgi:hypothetical protein